jgi:CheY-like chemotaxis protein
MDPGMPQIDGIEATRRIVNSQRRVRVLMLSAHDETHRRNIAENLGVRSLAEVARRRRMAAKLRSPDPRAVCYARAT